MTRRTEIERELTLLVWCRHLVLATLDPGLQCAVHCRLIQRCSNWHWGYWKPLELTSLPVAQPCLCVHAEQRPSPRAGLLRRLDLAAYCCYHEFSSSKTIHFLPENEKKKFEFKNEDMRQDFGHTTPIAQPLSYLLGRVTMMMQKLLTCRKLFPKTFKFWKFSGKNL